MTPRHLTRWECLKAAALTWLIVLAALLLLMVDVPPSGRGQ